MVNCTSEKICGSYHDLARIDWFDIDFLVTSRLSSGEARCAKKTLDEGIRVIGEKEIESFAGNSKA